MESNSENETLAAHLRVTLRDSPPNYEARATSLAQVSKLLRQQVLRNAATHKTFLEMMLQRSLAHPEKHADLCQRWAAEHGEGRPQCETEYCSRCRENCVDFAFWDERLRVVRRVREALHSMEVERGLRTYCEKDQQDQSFAEEDMACVQEGSDQSSVAWVENSPDYSAIAGSWPGVDEYSSDHSSSMPGSWTDEEEDSDQSSVAGSRARVEENSESYGDFLRRLQERFASR